MKRLIISTVVLVAAVICITVVYFRHLNPPAAHTAQVMQNIPNTAALVFEFSNDDGFYDIFSGNSLLKNIIGDEKESELSAVRTRILTDPLLKNFFDGQHIYISLHGQAQDSIDFLITIAGTENFSIAHLDQLFTQKNKGMLVEDIKLGGKEAYAIYLSDLKKRFYLVDKGNHIFSGSFSKELAEQSAQYQPQKNNQSFILIPDQQNTNSLANLYVNYAQLTPLFNQLFQSNNTGIFKSLRMLPALGALTMNYKSDALMFNGFTHIQRNQPQTYLCVFRNQQPIEGHLNELFPSTTAISICISLSDVRKFTDDLSNYHVNAGLSKEKKELFSKVKSETGEKLVSEFNKQLGNEFAMLTTRFDERIGIIAIKDGSAMRPLMVNISNMVNDDVGQFKYEKLPYYLLGDIFGALNRPYFMILDNYLILANSQGELNSYKDSYQNQKLLNKTNGYTDFDNLLAERCNIACFLHFRNMFPILKRDLKPAFTNMFNPGESGHNQFYGLSWQLTASDGNYFTNFCLKLNKADSTSINN